MALEEGNQAARRRSPTTVELALSDAADNVIASEHFERL
jgi:hypothetical protein